MRVLTRKQAVAQGLRFYFTSQPCPRGHVAKRYTSCFACVVCSQDVMQTLKEETIKRKATDPLSPRQAAIAAGLKRYKPDYPCPKGHHADRYVSTGGCVICARLTVRHNRTKPKVAAYRKAYSKKYKHRFKAYAHNRRAKRKGSKEQHTGEDVLAILKRQRSKCVYCPVTLTKYHVDHRHPLSKGGSNGKCNIQLLCQTCNLRKHNKTDAEFRQELHALASLSPKAKSTPYV